MADSMSLNSLLLLRETQVEGLGLGLGLGFLTLKPSLGDAGRNILNKGWDTAHRTQHWCYLGSVVDQMNV